MNVNEVRKFMETCPFLKGKKINMNCLGGKSMSYSIETVACEPLIKKYCDGGSLRQFRFIFAMRAPYDENFDENGEIAQHFSNIADWIEVQDKNKNLPKIKDVITTAERIEVVSRGHLYESSIDSMKLQMEVVLVYRQQDYPPGIVSDDIVKGEDVII